MTKEQVSLNFDEWTEQFSPSETAYHKKNGDLEFIKSQDPKYVWTWIDDGGDTLVNGFVDVELGWYYICKNSWNESKDYKIVMSVKVECVCYDEDGYENGDGYENCEECEGTGYTRKWTRTE
jgi:hypothetical protein